MILNLSIWFALHTIFGVVSESHHYGVRLWIPDWTTVDWMAVAISRRPRRPMFRFKMGMLITLASAAVVGLLYSQLELGV